MGTIISLILSIFFIYVYYKIFETYGKNAGIGAVVGLNLITYLINNASEGIEFAGIIIALIVYFVEALIAWKVFEKTNGFWSFFGWLLLITIIIEILIVVLVGFLVVGAFSMMVF